jgi:hypothetical protein
MLLRGVRHTKVHSEKTERSATETCRGDDKHRAEDLLGQFPMLRGTPATDVARREQLAGQPPRPRTRDPSAARTARSPPGGAAVPPPDAPRPRRISPSIRSDCRGRISPGASGRRPRDRNRPPRRSGPSADTGARARCSDTRAGSAAVCPRCGACARGTPLRRPRRRDRYRAGPCRPHRTADVRALL